MSNNKEILFLKPYFVDLIWGGTKLHDKFNFNIPSNTTGEAWLISAYPNQNSIVKNGRYKDCSLDCLWSKHPELFGNLNLKEFPLLVKLIDAKKDLSVQVHPDDIYANKNENGQLGKKECWYVVDCNKNVQEGGLSTWNAACNWIGGSNIFQIIIKNWVSSYLSWFIANNSTICYILYIKKREK